MLPGALTWCVDSACWKGHRSLPVGVEAVPPFVCPLSIPPLYSAEKPHVFRKATKEVAFRNTCGFWTFKMYARA